MLSWIAAEDVLDVERHADGPRNRVGKFGESSEASREVVGRSKTAAGGQKRQREVDLERARTEERRWQWFRAVDDLTNTWGSTPGSGGG